MGGTVLIFSSQAKLSYRDFTEISQVWDLWRLQDILDQTGYTSLQIYTMSRRTSGYPQGHSSPPALLLKVRYVLLSTDTFVVVLCPIGISDAAKPRRVGHVRICQGGHSLPSVAAEPPTIVRHKVCDTTMEKSVKNVMTDVHVQATRFFWEITLPRVHCLCVLIWSYTDGNCLPNVRSEVRFLRNLFIMRIEFACSEICDRPKDI